jgi:gliotoxin/aspirochlorine biosynthesis gamma-glutamylcyclotransferase
MVLVSTLGLPKDNVWYLAYGSNLSSSKFVRDRGIKPLAAVVVAVPGLTLSMESAGVPYQEPSYATIHPVPSCANGKEITALGTAYLVTPSQYADIIRSEGGGIAYKEISVRVTPLDKVTKLEYDSLHGTNAEELSEARTLVSIMTRLPAPCPSQRYMVSTYTELHTPSYASIVTPTQIQFVTRSL